MKKRTQSLSVKRRLKIQKEECLHKILRYRFDANTVHCAECGKYWIDPKNPFGDMDPQWSLNVVAKKGCKASTYFSGSSD